MSHLDSDSRSQSRNTWIPLTASLTGLFLTALLPVPRAQAACGPGIGAVTALARAADGSGLVGNTPDLAVHVGDTIFIDSVNVGNQQNSFASSNLDVYLLLPNGTTNHVATAVRMVAGSSCGGTCNGPAGAANFSCGVHPSLPIGAVGTCLAFPNTYVVNTADLGRCLSFAVTKGNLTTAIPPVCPGPKGLEFLQVAAGNALQNVAGCPIVSGANAAATPNQEVLVIFPCISITKLCDVPCTPYGQPICFHGTVTNSGDVPLHTIVVTDVSPAGTVVIPDSSFDPVQPSGRVWDGTLGVGESAVYHGCFTPPDNGPTALCGPFTDAITATAIDPTGLNISNTDDCINPNIHNARQPVTTTCNVCNNPGIDVTKNCPAVPVAPGAITTISGVVSNSGNITLTNVLVFDDLPAPNTLLLGPITLAPEQTATFTNSYQLPPNCCTYVDTVGASGEAGCSAQRGVTPAWAPCQPAPDPRLSVTKICPAQPVPLGELLVFSGTVSNEGNITLTDVTVVNNQPSNNSPVLGPMTLAPGQAANFTGSYRVPTDLCETNLSDTLTARGNNLCNGVQITTNASAQCPIVPRARLVVTKNCPPEPVPPGGVLIFSGMVSNAGNVTLTNVIVVNDRPTNHTPVLGPITLAPQQATNFSGSYTVCPECCPPYVDTI